DQCQRQDVQKHGLSSLDCDRDERRPRPVNRNRQCREELTGRQFRFQEAVVPDSRNLGKILIGWRCLQSVTLSRSKGRACGLPMLRFPPFFTEVPLSYAQAPTSMLHIFPDASSIADHVSRTLVEKIQSKPDVVLGLATGGTMEPVYARFVEQARAQRLDVSRLTSFNLDEYVGLPADHPKSYAAYMNEHLFRHLDFDASRLHLPDGLAQDLHQHCQEYSDRILQSGGI